MVRSLRALSDGEPPLAAFLDAWPPCFGRLRSASPGSRALPESSPSTAGGKARVSRASRQFGKLGLAHVYERGVVAAFEIDLRLVTDARLDDGVEAIAFADRRDRPQYAILEQLPELVFRGQGEGLAEFRPEVRPADPARRRQHGEHIPVARADDDALGQAFRRDAAGLRGRNRRHGRRMGNDV